MPRRKVIRIYAAELECWDKKLKNHPLFQDADSDNIHIVSKQRSPDLHIMDAEKPNFIILDPYFSFHQCSDCMY